ncbi:M4 family metallopeptidase [Polyangium aurulentum]|uniref:M4 family metallopeptidase n=1 Tax=Polyangium aurulentum TaxID=2567896 RepID=UPI001981C921|nr:M4 family metallopeptidase [Polyangium aurulentum]UQA56431.1 M4 family metallopeptidase [Polyangium aurulentum]
MIRYKLLRGMGVAAVLLAAAACQGTGAGAGDRRDERAADILAHLAALPAAEVVQVDDDAIPRFVAGNLGSLALAERIEETDFRAALSAIAPALSADAGELSLRRARTDEQGDRHFRFSQTKNGLPVIGAEIVLHVRDGVIIAANGGARSDLPADEVAVIDRADAIRAARNSTEAADVSVQDEAKLAYHARGERLALVYQVEVEGKREDGTPVRDTVLVDAADGSIALRIPHIHEAKNRQVYLAVPLLNEGILMRSEGQAPNGNPSVDINYDWLGWTYDCYKNLFGRDSYDGAGSPVVSIVDYVFESPNAYWDGTQMVFGQGDGVTSASFGNAMDITAHEFTHGVSNSESGLVGTGESGALGEAMGDIFGAVCEWYRDGQVVSGKTWILGDEVWTPSTPGDGIRYMANPAQDGDSLDFYDSSAGNQIHRGAGIANLAFHLLAQGGTHPQGKSSINVPGIGILKAARVFYKANTDILTSYSNYLDAKNATVQAATQLGYTQAEIDAVKKAWDAVGVVPPPPPPTTPLQNNVPLTNLSGSLEGFVYYSIDVPAGATNLVFKTSGGTGNIMMSVQLGWGTTSQACVPTGSGTSQTCSVSSVQAGTYYVSLFGFPPYSGVTLKASFTPPPASTSDLVINEIDYDTVGTDDREYVEIYNPAGGAVSLSGCSLLLVNGGTGTVYSTVDLSGAGSLGAGQYLVVGSSSVAVPAGAKKVNFSLATNSIQNDTEGVALVCGASVVDKLSYEGSVTAATLPGVGTVSLVEGTAFNVADSNTVPRTLCRLPNGSDTDNASVDWSTCATLTPGASN